MSPPSLQPLPCHYCPFPSPPLPCTIFLHCCCCFLSLFSRERENEFLSFSSLLHIPDEKEELGRDGFMEHYETGIYSIYCETGEEDFRSESCSFGRGRRPDKNFFAVFLQLYETIHGDITATSHKGNFLLPFVTRY